MTSVGSLFETYSRAVLEKDVDAFTSIFDEDIHIFDMWQWTYEGLSSWREMAMAWFSSLGSETVAVTFDDIHIHEAGDMASATAFVRFAAVSPAGEELRFLQNRLTWVARKKDGRWKIFHEHTSGPADHRTLEIILKR